MSEGIRLAIVDPYGLLGAADLPMLPQSVVDFSAGWGDSLSFGLTNYIRNQWDINSEVNQCSSAYSGGKIVGTVHGAAVPIGRIAYVVKARGIATAGLSAEASVAARNTLKSYFRGPFSKTLENWHSVTYDGLVASGKTAPTSLLEPEGKAFLGRLELLDLGQLGP